MNFLLITAFCIGQSTLKKRHASCAKTVKDKNGTQKHKKRTYAPYNFPGRILVVLRSIESTKSA